MKATNALLLAVTTFAAGIGIGFYVGRKERRTYTFPSKFYLTFRLGDGGQCNRKYI